MNIEQFIYETYKEQPIKGKRDFIKLINKKFSGVDVREVYIKIYNYQVKKYGKTLDNNVELPTYEEKIKCIQRDYKRRKYNGIHKKIYK